MKKNKITEENEFLLREEMMAYQRTPRSSHKNVLETVSEEELSANCMLLVESKRLLLDRIHNDFQYK